MPLDQQIWCPGPQFVQQPTANAGALGQQSQDAITMASALWRMMSIMLQQQQRMTFPRWTWKTKDTSSAECRHTRRHAQMSGCDGYTEDSSTDSSIDHSCKDAFGSCSHSVTYRNDSPGCSVLPQYPGKKQPSSQDAQDRDSPNAYSRLNAFTLDPPTLHRLPADIKETTDMSQQGDEELVPEVEYEVFRQPVRSSLGRFHSSGDNADGFQEEIGSLIPTDEVFKDKLTWDMQTSLKASLAYCAKIAQGVVTTDQIVDTPLCAPPSAQMNVQYLGQGTL